MNKIQYTKFAKANMFVAVITDKYGKTIVATGSTMTYLRHNVRQNIRNNHMGNMKFYEWVKVDNSEVSGVLMASKYMPKNVIDELLDNARKEITVDEVKDVPQQGAFSVVKDGELIVYSVTEVARYKYIPCDGNMIVA